MQRNAATLVLATAGRLPGADRCLSAGGLDLGTARSR
jgi:hypothetical protein